MSNTQKELPHDLAAERAVIKSIIFDNSLIGDVISAVSGSDFYARGHGVVWETMRGMIAFGRAIDELTLTNTLISEGKFELAGGENGINDIMSSEATQSNAAEYAGIVRDCANRRKLIGSCNEMMAMAYAREKTAVDLVEGAQQAVLALVQSDGAGRAHLTAREYVDSLMSRLRSRAPAASVATGIPMLDDLIGGGLRDGELVVMAARPGMGKSTLAMQIGAHAAKSQRKHVGVVSLEMDPEDMCLRLSCADGNVVHSAARDKKLDKAGWKALIEAADELAKLPLHVTDQISSINKILAWAYGMKLQGKLDLLIVDYLQIIAWEGRSEGRRAEIESMTRQFKQLARRLRIPVILLSQLSRAADEAGFVPELKHLRESGSIEQDADIVLMIHKPEGMMKEIREIWVRKQRNGPPNVAAQVVFEDKYCRFSPVPDGMQLPAPRERKKTTLDDY